MNISTRQRSWHHRFSSAFKKLFRNKYVFRWALFGLRVLAEIRKFITDST